MGNLIFEHGGNVYQAEKKYRRALLDFSANINPTGLPTKIKNRLYENFQSILHYPDINSECITNKIAEYWHVKKENILVGNGSVDLIYLLLYTFQPKKTLIPHPTFSEYERAAHCVGSKVIFLRLSETKNFQFQGLNSTDADVLFLCNPNNPTGNLIFKNRKLIEGLSEKLSIIDESFMDFLPDEEKYTLIWKAQKNKRIAVLRTFTKFFALPGIRIGYLVAHRNIVNKLKQRQVPWSVNSFAQLAAELVLSDKEYIKKTRQLVGKERAFLFTEIAGIKKLNPYPSVTNFLLVKINDVKLTSSLLRMRLIRRGILIRDCVNFRGLSNKFIRVAVRSHNENLKLIKALKEAV
jgi:threonine-phosphate decarboxylase